MIFNHFSQNILITTVRGCEVAVNQSIEVGQSQGLIKDLIAREICKMFNRENERIFFFHFYSFLFFVILFFCLFVFDSFFLLFLNVCSRMFGDLILKTCAIIIILQFCKTSFINARDLIKESI